MLFLILKILSQQYLNSDFYGFFLYNTFLKCNIVSATVFCLYLPTYLCPYFYIYQLVAIAPNGLLSVCTSNLVSCLLIGI